MDLCVDNNADITFRSWCVSVTCATRNCMYFAL